MTEIWINEIHYENILWDVGEGVEVAGPAGTSLAGWSLAFYTGDKGLQYLEKKIKGLIPNLQSGFGTIFFPTKGIKNGSSSAGSGIALIDQNGEVRQFISYDGPDGFIANDGVAKGTKSTKIPVRESRLNAPGQSLQLEGTGNKYEDFKWTGPKVSNFGSVNAGQKFVPKGSNSSNSTPTTGRIATDIVDTQTAQNRKEHFTDSYHTKDMLILRRGFEFRITLKLPSANAAKNVSVIIEDYPEKAAKATLKVNDKSTNSDKWEAYYDNVKDKVANILVSIPPDAPVGQYSLNVQIENDVIAVSDPITVLFNPWCEEDAVYMEDKADREEYVLNDDGLIWTGSVHSNGPRAWNYGQFNTKSLLCSLLLLESLPLKDRGNSVLVSRHLSAIVNSNDDGGILVGNWSGNYSGGSSPSSWTGSAEIMKQYYLNRSSVKYGQCWVFSGVLTAVCRSLGLPCRSLTNFASAHEATQPYHRSVDKYLKKGGLEEDDRNTIDSIWNFHCWNDVWTARPDLGDVKYNGWQTIDSTPQELSGRLYRCGPCPLVAIKNGDKNINYDLEFIYSEVNADVNYYVEKDGGGYDLIKTVTDAVGINMTTKAVGSNNRHDITLDYKYPEGTAAERVSHGIASVDTKGDVTASIELADNLKMGDPVTINISLQRKQGTTSQNLHADVFLVVTAVSYAGRREPRPVKDIKGTVTVPTSNAQSASLSLTIKPEDYTPLLHEDQHFNIRTFIQVKETKQLSFLEKQFSFVNQPIILNYLGTTAGLRVGTKGKVEVAYTNPLQVPLTNVILRVEGQALTKVQTFNIGTIEPGKTITQIVEIEALEEQNHFLIASIECKELHDINGHIELLVLK